MLSDGLHDVPAGKVAMVVTHLEMTAPADTREVPLAPGVTFEAKKPDVAWYRDIFDRVGAPWLWFGRRKLTDEALERILLDPQVAVFSMSVEGRDEGLLELDFRTQGECELAYFGLTDKLMGTGAGRFLMNRAIGLAWSQPIRRFHVHTCTIDSPKALDFYVRSGFRPYRTQVEVADDPRLTGILPRDVAPHVPIIG